MFSAQPESALRRDIQTQNGCAIHFKDALRRADRPQYQDTIEKLGLDVAFFTKNLNGTNNKWVGDPVEMDFPVDKPTEHLVIRNALTPDGKLVEVTSVSDFVATPMKVRLPRPAAESIGFEAIYLQKGSITYTFAERLTQRGGEFIAEGALFTVTLQPGDLLILPRGMARQVFQATPGSEYLYFGDPWTKEDMPKDVYSRPMKIPDILTQ